MPWLRAIVIGAALTAGCALSPSGEADERNRAIEAGRAFEQPPELPVLTKDSGMDDYLQYAFLKNADLRTRYWMWRAALEQVPQDSSFPNPAVSFSYLFSKENMRGWDRTTLGISNDPMSDIPFPPKVAAAGRRALEEARAAGLRFEQAKFLLQGQILATWYDLALLGESIRIQTDNVGLLRQVVDQMEVRVKVGAVGQQDLLKAQTELDLAQNDLENLRDQAVPAAVARMNALLSRKPDAPVALPPELPRPRLLDVADDQLVRIGSERSPELAALGREIAGREEALTLARLEAVPDFGLSFSITGSLSRVIGAMVTVPLRVQAIRAAIDQARANLRAAEAARVQYEHDLAASFIINLRILRNDERQIELFEKVVLPRAKLTVEIAQGSYAAGRTGYLEVIDAQRTYLDSRLALAQVRTEREKSLAAIETWSTATLETMAKAGK